jgi:hypothetical protein
MKALALLALFSLVAVGCKDGAPAPTAAAEGTLPPGHPEIGTAASGMMPEGHPEAAAAPSGMMPEGHPGTGAAAEGTLPPGHPKIGAAMPGMMPAGHPETGAAMPGMMPSGHPEAGGLPELPSGTISGRIQVAPELADRVTAGDVVFVMARNAATGSLIDVSRIEISKMPAPFSLAGQNVMHSGSPLAGKVRLEVRLDRDGDAMTKNPGDLVNNSEELVTVPAEDVVVTLTNTL